MHVNDFIGSLPKIRPNGTVSVGNYIDAIRLDGRVFTGKVEKISSVDNRPDDTLVIVKREDGSYRSFYLKNLKGWLVTG